MSKYTKQDLLKATASGIDKIKNSAFLKKAVEKFNYLIYEKPSAPTPVEKPKAKQTGANVVEKTTEDNSVQIGFSDDIINHNYKKYRSAQYKPPETNGEE